MFCKNIMNVYINVYIQNNKKDAEIQFERQKLYA